MSLQDLRISAEFPLQTHSTSTVYVYIKISECLKSYVKLHTKNSTLPSPVSFMAANAASPGCVVSAAIIQYKLSMCYMYIYCMACYLLSESACI